MWIYLLYYVFPCKQGRYIFLCWMSVCPCVCLSVLKIVSAQYTCVRCSPHEGDVQNPCSNHTSSRSSSLQGRHPFLRKVTNLFVCQNVYASMTATCFYTRDGKASLRSFFRVNILTNSSALISRSPWKLSSTGADMCSVPMVFRKYVFTRFTVENDLWYKKKNQLHNTTIF